MNLKVSVYLGILFLLICRSAFTASKKDPQISSAIDLIFKEDYRQAATVLDSAITRAPANPEGYFYRGVIFWRKSTMAPDYKSFDEKMQIWLERCRSVADSALKQNQQDANAWFYLGGAHGFLGSMYARRGKWLKTGYHAWKGISALEKALELDPEMYDIYYGLGLYHVMAGHQGAVVRFIQRLLPIPTGNPEKGLSALKISIEKGRYAPVPAQSALILAYLYFEKDFPNAIAAATPLLEKYPENTDLLSMIINAHFYNSLKNPQSQGKIILNYTTRLENILTNRKQKINSWWQQKLVFLKGYANYLLGNYPIAISFLQQYSKYYQQNGDSYLQGLSELIQGKIYDLQGQQHWAKTKYRLAKSAEKFGNVSDLAKKLLDEPGSSPILQIEASVTGFPERP